MTRPEVEALHRALLEQARESAGYVGPTPDGERLTIDGDFDLAPLVDAVLAAHAAHAKTEHFPLGTDRLIGELAREGVERRLKVLRGAVLRKDPPAPA